MSEDSVKKVIIQNDFSEIPEVEPVEFQKNLLKSDLDHNVLKTSHDLPFLSQSKKTVTILYHNIKVLVLPVFLLINLLVCSPSAVTAPSRACALPSQICKRLDLDACQPDYPIDSL